MSTHAHHNSPDQSGGFATSGELPAAPNHKTNKAFVAGGTVGQTESREAQILQILNASYDQQESMCAPRWPEPGDVRPTKEQVQNFWREHYKAPDRAGGISTLGIEPPFVEPGTMDACDAKIIACGCSSTYASFHNLVIELYKIRSKGKGPQILEIRALTLITDQKTQWNAARYPTAESLAKVLAEHVSGVEPAKVAWNDPGDEQPLALIPGQAAKFGGVRVRMEFVPLFNRLLADACQLKLRGIDPTAEVQQQNAYQPDRERLPAEVTEALLSAVIVADARVLLRTAQALEYPVKETERLNDKLAESETRQRAIRAGVLPDRNADFGIFSLKPSEAARRRDQIQTRYLVENLIVKGQYGTIIAPSKAGKTLVSLAIGLYGALGRDVWNCPSYGVSQPFRTLMLTKESEPGFILRTAQAFAAAQGVELADLDAFESCTQHGPVNDPLVLKNLKTRIEDEKFDLIILDPLVKAVSFPANTSSDQQVFYSTMQPIVDAVKDAEATLLITHHTTKGSARNPTRRIGLFDATGAGHDGWARYWLGLNRRVAYSQDRPGHHEWHLASGISGGRGVSVNVTFDEYDGDGNPIWSDSWAEPRRAPDRTSDEPEEAEEHEDETAREELNRRRTTLQGLIDHGPIGASTLSNRISGSRETVARLCEWLVENGFATRIETDAGRIQYESAVSDTSSLDTESEIDD